MVSITITRRAKLEKPMGLGEGRISEGLISADWGSARTINAKDVGLRSISNLIVSPGTPLDIEAAARILSAGSVGNTARVIAFLKQKANIRVGTPRYYTYPVAFTGSPHVTIQPGSPTASPPSGSVSFHYIQTQRPGSFKAIATPTFANSHYIAIGPGSYPLNYIAVGN